MPNSIEVGREDPMAALGRMVVNTEYEDLRNDSIGCAKRSILDTMGVIIAGSSADGCKEVVDQVSDWGGKEESTIWIYGGKVPATLAGLALGTMARACDLGDVHQLATCHISEYVMPAAFPAAEHQGKVSGKDFITAVAVAQDLGIRLGMTAPINASSTMGTISSIFAATAAVAKLLRLDENTTLNAMGIAYNQACNERQCNEDGALTIRLHHGFVADAAIKSALLAQRGITGARNILAGKYGFYRAFAPRHNLAPITSGLGKTLDGAYNSDTSIKLYPCCRCAHGAIDAAIDLAKEYDIKPQEVAEIDVAVSDWAFTYVGEPLEIKRNPRNIVDSQFSLPYTIATALVRRSVFIDDFTEEALNREAVRDLMKTVTPRIDSSLATAENPLGGTAMTIKTRQGREYSKVVPYPRGHPQNPVTLDDVIEKFRKCALFAAKPLPEANVDQIIKMIVNLGNVSDVAKIIELVR